MQQCLIDPRTEDSSGIEVQLLRSRGLSVNSAVLLEAEDD